MTIADYVDFENGSCAVFCGAGISRNSGIPIAPDLIRAVLESFNIGKQHIQTIVSLNLPFEVVMGILRDSVGIDDLLDIFRLATPNANHFLLAQLAKERRIIALVTTNFDTLIEHACRLLGLEQGQDFVIYCNERDFQELDFGNMANGPFRIFKIHGSISDPQTIRVTLDYVASKVFSSQRRSILRYLFANEITHTGNHRKVLVLGYSCSDSFDITPAIEEFAPYSKEVLVIDHTDGRKLSVEDVKNKSDRNPFHAYRGLRLKVNTGVLNCFLSPESASIAKSQSISHSHWREVINEWYARIRMTNGLRNYVIGELYRAGSLYNQALMAYTSAHEHYHRSNDNLMHARTAIRIGACYAYKERYRDSIDSYEEALMIARALADKRLERVCCSGLMLGHMEMGDIDKADEYNKLVFELTEDSDQPGIDHVFSIGLAYSMCENTDAALSLMQWALDRAEQLGDIDAQIRCHSNIAKVCANARLNQDAIRHYLTAEDLCKKTNKPALLMTIYFNLATHYYSTEQLRKALEYYARTLELSHQLADKAVSAVCYFRIAIVLILLGDNDGAFIFLAHAGVLYQKLKDKAMEEKCAEGCRIIARTKELSANKPAKGKTPL